MFIQCWGSVLHLSFCFVISFSHVGQISFQYQPNALCTNIVCEAKNKIDYEHLEN